MLYITSVVCHFCHESDVSLTGSALSLFNVSLFLFVTKESFYIFAGKKITFQSSEWIAFPVLEAASTNTRHKSVSKKDAGNLWWLKMIMRIRLVAACCRAVLVVRDDDPLSRRCRLHRTRSAGDASPVHMKLSRNPPYRRQLP